MIVAAIVAAVLVVLAELAAVVKVRVMFSPAAVQDSVDAALFAAAAQSTS